MELLMALLMGSLFGIFQKRSMIMKRRCGSVQSLLYNLFSVTLHTHILSEMHPWAISLYRQLTKQIH
uniref:Uncharacterized protein n=1 Tax=Chenopodium quinoa TaxID=63459 RepID=A0A803NBV4_CHEQI